MIQKALAIKKTEDRVLDKGAGELDDFGVLYPPDGLG